MKVHSKFVVCEHSTCRTCANMCSTRCGTNQIEATATSTACFRTCFQAFWLVALLTLLYLCYWIFLSFSCTFFLDCQNQFRPNGSRQCCYLMASMKYYKLKSTIYKHSTKNCNNNNSISGIDAFNLIDNFVFLVKLILCSVCICLSVSFQFHQKPKTTCDAPALYETTESGWFLCKQPMPRGSPVHGSWQWFFVWMSRRQKRSWLQPSPTNGMWCFFTIFFFLN